MSEQFISKKVFGFSPETPISKNNLESDDDIEILTRELQDLPEFLIELLD
jgi:hypothetical protein